MLFWEFKKRCFHIWVTLEIDLRQEFECKWLIWEVIPRDPDREVGKGDKSIKGTFSGSYYSGQLGFDPPTHIHDLTATSTGCLLPGT